MRGSGKNEKIKSLKSAKNTTGLLKVKQVRDGQ